MYETIDTFVRRSLNLPCFSEILARITSTSNLKIQEMISELNELSDDEKFVLALYNYKKFYESIPNGYSLNSYLKIIDIIIMHFNKSSNQKSPEKIIQPENILESKPDQKFLKQVYEVVVAEPEKTTTEIAFQLEIRKIIQFLKNHLIISLSLTENTKSCILKTFKSWIKQRSEKLNDEKKVFYEVLRFWKKIKDMNGLLTKIKASNSESDKIMLKSNIKKLIYNKLVKYDFALNFVIETIYETQLSRNIEREILDIVQNIVSENHLPITSLISNALELALPNYFDCRVKDLIQGRKLIKLILKIFDQVIIDSNSNYFNTIINEDSRIDKLGVNFLNLFMNSYDDFYKLSIESLSINTKIGKILSVKSIFISINRYSKQMQMAIIEIMIQALQSNKINAIKYMEIIVFGKKLKLKPLSQYLKNIFLLKASSNPFEKVLIQFLADKSLNLVECLRKMIDQTYVMKLPKNISGINLSNGNVILKKFKKGKYMIGATFYMFLHEAAHFLQRIKSVNFADSDRPFSAELGIQLDINEVSPNNHKNWSNSTIMEVITKMINKRKIKHSIPRSTEERKSIDQTVISLTTQTENIEKNNLLYLRHNNEINEQERKSIGKTVLSLQKQDEKIDTKIFQNLEQIQVKIHEERKSLVLKTPGSEKEHENFGEANIQILEQIDLIDQEKISTDPQKQEENLRETNFQDLNKQILKLIQFTKSEIEIESSKDISEIIERLYVAENNEEESSRMTLKEILIIERETGKLTEAKEQFLSMIEEIVKILPNDYYAKLNDNQENLDEKEVRIEGGKILEVAIFGVEYDLIFIRGTEFLMSDLTGYSLPEFRELFNKENVRSSISEPGQNLKRRYDRSSLGICGFHYLTK